MTNMARATAAVKEFLNIWECGGTASLKLDTSQGGCKVSFTAHLGHPGALLETSPPPTSPSFQPAPTNSPPSGQRYRGPADKQRSRLRAAARQAAATPTAPSVPVPVPANPALNAGASASPSATMLLSTPERPTLTLEMPGSAVLSTSPCAADLPSSPPEAVGSVTPSPVSPIPQSDGAYALPPPAPPSAHSAGDAIGLLPLCPNCEQPMSSSHQCNASSSEVDNVTEKTEMQNVTPARPRRLNMMKFCDNCNTLHQYGFKCPSCHPAKPVPP